METKLNKQQIFQTVSEVIDKIILEVTAPILQIG